MLPEELPILQILTNDVKIQVRLGSEWRRIQDNNRHYAGRLHIDNTYASTSYNVISHTKVRVPEKLKNFNLQVNETKTEEYEVPDMENLHVNGSWTKCKLLGSLLDTKEDIQRPLKNLTISHMKDKKNLYKSKNLSIIQKIRWIGHLM